MDTVKLLDATEHVNSGASAVAANSPRTSNQCFFFQCTTLYSAQFANENAKAAKSHATKY